MYQKAGKRLEDPWFDTNYQDTISQIKIGFSKLNQWHNMDFTFEASKSNMVAGFGGHEALVEITLLWA